MRNVNYFGLAVAVICSAVSLGLIIDYAMGASDSPWRVAAYAAVGVAALVWENTGLHRGDHLKREKRYGAAFLCYAGLAMAILITVSYEIGSLAELMESKASIGESKAGERAALESERAILMGQAKKAGDVRPVAAIQGDIDAIKAHPRWTSSGGCTNVTAPESKELCGSYGRLAAEVGAATAIAAASARIVDLNGKLQPLAASKIADARASYLSKLSGMPEIDSRIAVSLLVIAFLLFGRVAGGYVFMDSRGNAEKATIAVAATEARTATEAATATIAATKTEILPPLPLLEDAEYDFDDGKTPEEIEALWDMEQEQAAVAALNAGQPVAAPIITKPEPAPLNPVQVARREVVKRYCDDCLTFHRQPNSETGRPYRETSKLVWEGFEIWLDEVEIGEEWTRAAFGLAFGPILEDNGGRSLKSSEIYYEGVTMKPSHAHRVGKRADLIANGAEVALPVVNDQPNRLGSVLRDRRRIAIDEVAGTA